MRFCVNLFLVYDPFSLPHRNYKERALELNQYKSALIYNISFAALNLNGKFNQLPTASIAVVTGGQLDVDPLLGRLRRRCLCLDGPASWGRYRFP